MTTDVLVPDPETEAANGHGSAHSTAGFKALTLGSIGVVYGDIGTSPLYALREAVVAASGPSGIVSPQAVLGVVWRWVGRDGVMGVGEFWVWDDWPCAGKVGFQNAAAECLLKSHTGELE